MADFNKAGLLVIRDNAFLMCRKDRGTSRLILPGGRIEPGETPLACLEREVREELGEDVAIAGPQLVGTYRDRAHFDDPAIIKTLEIMVYRGGLTGDPRPCSEITELIWFGPDSDRRLLTPVTRDRILPDLVSRGILAW